MSSVVVRYERLEQEPETIEGDCVLGYGKEYMIDIVCYKFSLIWRQTEPEPLRALAVRDYQRALQQQVNVRSRNLPTEGDSEVHTWHNTRIHTARRILFREADEAPRVVIGEGQFGAVYRAVDLESGHAFAVKVIKLHQFPDVEQARAVAHREVKALQKLSHVCCVSFPSPFGSSTPADKSQKHIIEFLGHDRWESPEPEIFMPLRPGSLRSLAKSTVRRWTDDQLSMAVLEQMLSALDYLACMNVCHRDVKPENILYYDTSDNVIFQLADFGLANHSLLAVTKCGTGYYEAPELYPEYGQFAQSPKMDVWSLFATIADIHRKFSFPPTQAKTYVDVLRAIRAAALEAPSLADMVRENPHHRASAAQVLVLHFGGRGLSTPRAQVPPIKPPPATSAASTAAVASASVPAPQAPTIAPARRPAATPLVKYPREPRRNLRQDTGRVPSPLRPLGGGITKKPPTVPGRPARRPAQVPTKERPEDRKERPERSADSLRIPGGFPV
jgi:serine/threonine protein kinase